VLFGEIRRRRVVHEVVGRRRSSTVSRLRRPGEVDHYMFVSTGTRGEAPSTFATARRIVSWFRAQIRRNREPSSSFAAPRGRRACARTLTPSTFVSNFRRTYDRPPVHE